MPFSMSDRVKILFGGVAIGIGALIAYTWWRKKEENEETGRQKKEEKIEKKEKIGRSTIQIEEPKNEKKELKIEESKKFLPGVVVEEKQKENKKELKNVVKIESQEKKENLVSNKLKDSSNVSKVEEKTKGKVKNEVLPVANGVKTTRKQNASITEVDPSKTNTDNSTRSEEYPDSDGRPTTNGVDRSSQKSSSKDDQTQQQQQAVYEFEIPKNVVGLIIGKKGVVINDLCNQSGASIIIGDHYYKDDYKLCTVEGTRKQINNCLRMIRRRFPPSRYPTLNLNPVAPPMESPGEDDLWGSGLVQLTLPDGKSCEALLSGVVDAGHFFLQQPTHPSFPSLKKVEQQMVSIYDKSNSVPELPKPVELGVICAAPSDGGWYRALTESRSENADELLIKYLDYGGYATVSSVDLRQIRSDFLTLPFQAIECYLAHVEPMDGDEGWSPAASASLEVASGGRVLEAKVASYAPDGIPFVELYSTVNKSETVYLNAMLVDEGYAVWTKKDKENGKS